MEGYPRLARLPTPLAALLVCLVPIGGCGGSSARPGASGTTRTTSGRSAAKAPATTPTATTPSASSPAGGPHVISVSSGGLTATLRAGTHSPRVDRPWPIHFAVTRGGRPVRASVSYEYLFAGQVVARRDHYTFTGHFSDVFVWPASAVGYPLTFRAVIASGASTLDLDYAVRVGA